MFGLRPEQEQRKVSTSGKWEDIERPFLQGVGLWLASIWQIVASLGALTSWAYAWSQSLAWEGPRNSAVATLLSAAVWLFAPFVFGVIISHERAQWLLGRPFNYEAISLSPGFNVAVVMTATIMFNVLFNNTVVYVLMTTQIVPIMATVIALTSWPAFNILKQSWRQELIMQAEINSDQAAIAKINNAHALEVLELQHQWEMERGIDVNALEDRAALAEQTAQALTVENDQLRNKPADIRIVPANHGSARFIGSREYTAVEVEALTTFVNGWPKRGTASAAWTTTKGREPFGGTGISDPQWRKITETLRGLGYLDSANRPTVSHTTVIEKLQLTPLLEGAEAENGRGLSSEPHHTTPHHAVLDSAISKLPSRRKDA
jgi:hypothetical protein